MSEIQSYIGAIIMLMVLLVALIFAPSHYRKDKGPR